MSETSKEYGLIQSFEIDDGSLDGVSPVEAFVLGVEWQEFYAIANGSIPAPTVSKLIHSLNTDRVVAMLKKHGWSCRLLSTPYGGWNEILIYPKTAST